MFGMAREANDVDLDKIVFLKLPVYSLDGEYAGRVGLSTERAGLLFEKIIADDELVLAKPNLGSGAVVEEGEEPATVSEEALPEWAQGTNAATKACSR